MSLQKNISLKPYNTFGVDAVADSFLVIEHKDQLKELAADQALAKQKYMALD